MSYQHSGQDKADVARRFTILRTQVGSGVHGVTIDDQDDRDEMGTGCASCAGANTPKRTP